MQTYAETIGVEAATKFGLDPNAVDPSTTRNDDSSNDDSYGETSDHGRMICRKPSDDVKVRKFKKNYSGQWN